MIFSTGLLNSFTCCTLTYYCTQLKITLTDLSNVIKKTIYLARLSRFVGVRFCMYVYNASRTIVSQEGYDQEVYRTT